MNIVPPNSAFGVSSQPEALLRELGVQLPRLVASVESDEARECLLPLLVYAACLHPEQPCRDQLLHALFNLSPKPNNVQRRLILQVVQRFCIPRAEKEEYILIALLNISNLSNDNELFNLNLL